MHSFLDEKDTHWTIGLKLITFLDDAEGMMIIFAEK